MSAVYHIEPAEKGISLGRLLSEAGVACPPEVPQDLQVLRIEVDASQNEWRLHLAGGVIPKECRADVEADLAAGLPAVDRVRLVTASDEGPGSNGLHEDEGDAAYLARLMTMRKAEEATPEPNSSPVERVLFGSVVRQRPVDMAGLDDEERSIVVEGTVFSIDVRPMRSGRSLVTFELTDHSSALAAKIFVEESKSDWLPQLKKGCWVRARGALQFDKFTQELTLTPKDLMLIPPPQERTDTANERRVELHLHTKMSALDGAADVEAVIAQAAAWGHPAVAITDHGVVQAFPEAYAAGKAHGVKVIFGVEGYLAESEEKKARTYHIILLAADKQGLKNLYRLVSDSHMHYFYRRPRVPKALLAQHREGILVGSACEAGELFQALLAGASDDELEAVGAFYDFFEIQPLANNQFHIDDGRVEGEEALKELNRKIVSLGRKMDKPVVATGDVHFLRPEDEIFRRIIMAGHGFADLERPSPLYLRTTDEMLEEFAYLGAAEARRVVIEDPRSIADRVESMRPYPDGFHPPMMDGADEELRKMAEAGAKTLYGEPLPELVRDRLERELDSVIGNGYASLYLIAQRLVSRSVEEGYAVGSRGSVGSSLVANLAGISEVNPLPPHYACASCAHFEVADTAVSGCGADLPHKACPGCGEPLRRDGYDIPFETFLGFKGDKVPDIDLNFAGEYQPRAHKYAEELFGEDHVFRGGTIGTLKDRTAYGYVRKFLEDKGVQARSAEINRLVQGCTGVRRTTGQHPGGLMIVPEGREIYEFTPIQYPANDRDSGVITTHFTYEAIHDHLVKLDLLGHDGPTVLHMLESLTGIPASEVPLDDQPTMQIFSGLDSLGIGPDEAGGEVGTLGIPEYGTGFVRQMLADTRPKSFADLVRIMGLSHGTDVWLNNAQELVRAGTVALEQTIACRDDIMLYLIRQGMDHSEAFRIMEAVRKGRGLTTEQEEAMRRQGVPRWYLDACRKISYLFPKAHAAAYATMAFSIAYYKVHHAQAFYATYFTVRADDADAGLLTAGPDRMRQALQAVQKKGNDATAKERSTATVLEVAIEAVARGVTFLPVDLYASDARRFVPEGDGLRAPLLALQGVGAAAADAVVSARSGRAFTSMDDLRKRAGVNKNVVEVLYEHGSLGDLPATNQMTLF